VLGQPTNYRLTYWNCTNRLASLEIACLEADTIQSLEKLLTRVEVAAARRVVSCCESHNAAQAEIKRDENEGYEFSDIVRSLSQ
jgi:hypothetical protein